MGGLLYPGLANKDHTASTHRREQDARQHTAFTDATMAYMGCQLPGILSVVSARTRTRTRMHERQGETTSAALER